MTNTFFKYLALSAAAIGLAACSAPTASDAPIAATPVVQTSVQSVVSTGTFSGLSDHETVGTATLVKTADGYGLLLSDDFELDGAPDPVIGFGADGVYDTASEVADLTHRTGEQTYTLPASFDPVRHTQVYVWCGEFSVPLGVANLTPAS